MWIVLGVVVVVVVWAVMRNRNHASTISSTTDRSAPSGDISVTVWRHDDTPAGKVVTLSNSVVLTLTGENAGAVLDYLARTANRLEEGGVEAARRRSFELALLMARYNVECPEVEVWRTALLKKVETGVRAELGPSGVAEDAAEEYRDEFVDLASEKLHELGVPYWIDYEEFAHPRPADTTADDAMLSRLAARTETLGDLAFYMVHAGSIVQSHQERSLVSLQGLVTAGYALPGREAPAEDLCREFTLAQLREAIGNAGKFRKKADAARFLAPDVRAKLPGVERLFYIKPLSPEDMLAMTAFRWMLTHAQLVQVTFRCAEKVSITTALHRGQKETLYSIAGECCPQSRRDRNPTTRVPANLPPYHIACTAQLEAD